MFERNLGIVQSGEFRCVPYKPLPGAHHQERPYILGGVPARLQMWLFLELKFPEKAVSIVPVVVSHRRSFLLRSSAILRKVCPFISKANPKFSHNISHSSKEA